MDVSKIVANVEYLQPRGIKECKTGWDENQVNQKLGLAEVEETSEGPSIQDSDFKGLRKQLNEGEAVKPHPAKSEVIIVGR